jgi:hypothetical protein
LICPNLYASRQSSNVLPRRSIAQSQLWLKCLKLDWLIDDCCPSIVRCLKFIFNIHYYYYYFFCENTFEHNLWCIGLYFKHFVEDFHTQIILKYWRISRFVNFYYILKKNSWHMSRRVVTLMERDMNQRRLSLSPVKLSLWHGNFLDVGFFFFRKS